MRTVYNGYETSFMIFKTDYEPITIERSDSKKEVWHVTNANGSSSTRDIFWTPTSEKNGVTIELEVKPHNRKKFISAVKNQFQNFNGRVALRYQTEADGTMHHDNLDEAPHYESESILIPRTSTYSVPTILVDGINYGPISWDELEWDNRRGALALKVHATDIDITQSRESVKYTEKTKKTIQKAINTAIVESNEYTSRELQIDDPYDIFLLARTYKYSDSNLSNITLTRFAEFLNITKVRPNYQFDPAGMDPKIIKEATLDEKLFHNLTYAYSIKSIRVQLDYDKPRVKSRLITSFDELHDKYFVFGKEAHLTGKIAHHIINTITDGEEFIYIRRNMVANRLQAEVDGTTYRQSTFDDYFQFLIDKHGNMFLDEQDFEFPEVEEELEDSVGLENDAAALAKLRKLNEEFYIHHHETSGYTNWTRQHLVNIADAPTRILEMAKGKEIVFYTSKFTRYTESLDVIMRDEGDYARYALFRVSQEYLRDVIHLGKFITDVFYTFDIDTKIMNIHPNLCRAHTSHMIEEVASPYDTYRSSIMTRFSEYFKQTDCNFDSFGTVGVDLRNFMCNIENYKKLQTEDSVEAQVFCQENFGVPYMNVDSCTFDYTWLKEYEKLEELLTPVKSIIKCIDKSAVYSGIHLEKAFEDIELLINIKNQKE